MTSTTLLNRVAKSRRQLPRRLKLKRKLIDCIEAAIAAGTLKEALVRHHLEHLLIVKILDNDAHFAIESKREQAIDSELLPSDVRGASFRR